MGRAFSRQGVCTGAWGSCEFSISWELNGDYGVSQGKKGIKWGEEVSDLLVWILSAAGRQQTFLGMVETWSKHF